MPTDRAHDLDEERAEAQAVRKLASTFIKKEIAPHYAEWEHAGRTPREIWNKMGGAGLLCAALPEEYGGGGARIRSAFAIVEAFSDAFIALPGFYTHSEICAFYLLRYGTEEQKKYWLPRCASGETVLAIAMSEPGAGSDLKNTRTAANLAGGGYRISGQKTFITNGLHADLAIVLASTDTDGRAGKTLFLVETDRPGFGRGRVLDKVGQKAQDTTELFLDDVKVPAENILGEPGQGLRYLMAQLARERLLVGVASVSNAEACFRETLAYTNERHAFGQPISRFQHLRFGLAEMKTDITVARVFLERCIDLYESGDLPVDQAAMCKYWLTDMEGRIIDRCVQMHGGYGYMREYPVARAFADARAQRIYAGTNEIMKEIVARSL